MRSRRVAWKMWEKGNGFREAAVTINRGASCVRAMLLNIVLAARNVKPPRSGKARGSFRVEIQALAGHSSISSLRYFSRSKYRDIETSHEVSRNKMWHRVCDRNKKKKKKKRLSVPLSIRHESKEIRSLSTTWNRMKRVQISIWRDVSKKKKERERIILDKFVIKFDWFVDKVSNQIWFSFRHRVFDDSLLIFPTRRGRRRTGWLLRSLAREMKSVLEKHDKENQRPMDTCHGDNENVQDAKDEE